MAATRSGKYRSKHTKELLHLAIALRDQGLTMQQIADTISAEYPELDGISAGTASTWSRGLVVDTALKAEVHERKVRRMVERRRKLAALEAMSNDTLARSLEIIAQRVGVLKTSQRRRMIRLVKEILWGFPREHRKPD